MAELVAAAKKGAGGGSKKVRKTPSKFMRTSGTTPRTPMSTESSRRQTSDVASSGTSGERFGSASERPEPVVNKFKVPVLMLTDGRQMQLLVVDMSNQALTAIPDNLWENHNIGVLDLSANNIHQVGHQVMQLTYLHELHVNNTSIRCRSLQDNEGLSKNLAKLNYLHTLSIQCCNLVYVPPVIWEMRNLTELYLNRNRIYQLPPEIGKLRKLKKLNLQLTGLTTLPPEIAYCQELEELVLYGNALQSLPETVAELTRLHTLGISYRVFTLANVDAYMENLIQKQQIQSEHVSPVVFQLRSLREMDLSYTKINTLPPHNLHSLTWLDLSNNYIRIFPESVAKLTKLRELNLSNNELSQIPDTITELSEHLRRLRMSSNKFDAIPEPIFSLTNLKELDISNNQISEIPDRITELSKLRNFNISSNNLRTLPVRISELAHLETFDIRNNHIVEVPGSIHKMESLNSMHSFDGLRRFGLWLLGNPELAIPPPVVWMGDDIGMLCDSVRRLTVQNLAKDHRLHPTRLILVGQSDAVKTAIAKQLLGINYIDRGSQICGIYRWRSSNGVPFVIYDLHTEFSAAQYLMPLFLVQASIVVLAFDFEELDNTEPTQSSNLEQWLDAITVCAPGTIIKLVAMTCKPGDAAQSQPLSGRLFTAPYCNQRTKVEFMKYIKRISAGIARFQTEVNEAPEAKSKLPAMKRIHAMTSTRLEQLGVMQETETLLRSCREVTLLDAWNNADRWEELEWQLELLATNSNLVPHVQMQVDRSWQIFGQRLLQKQNPLIEWKETLQEASVAEVDQEHVTDALEFLESCGIVCRYLPGKWIVVRPQQLMTSIEPILGQTPMLNDLVLRHRARFPLKKLEEAVTLFQDKGSLCEPLLKSAIFFPTAAKLTSMKQAEKMLEDFGLGYVRNDTEFQGKPRLQSWFTTSIIQLTRQDPGKEAPGDVEAVLAEHWPEAAAPAPDNYGAVQQNIEFWPVVGSKSAMRKLFQLFQVRLHQAAWLFMQPDSLCVAAEIRQADSEFAKAYVIASLQQGGNFLKLTVRAQDELFISWALDTVANVVNEFYLLFPGVLLSGTNCFSN